MANCMTVRHGWLCSAACCVSRVLQPCPSPQPGPMPVRLTHTGKQGAALTSACSAAATSPGPADAGQASPSGATGDPAKVSAHYSPLPSRHFVLGRCSNRLAGRRRWGIDVWINDGWVSLKRSITGNMPHIRLLFQALKTRYSEMEINSWICW